MCGIFGFVKQNKEQNFTFTEFSNILTNLFLLSESRGKEAAGLAVMTNDTIHVYKDSLSACKMLKSKEYADYLSNVYPFINNDSSVSVIGHTRLVTNGFQAIDVNNQPVKKDGMVVVHNGIITNINELWNRYPELSKRTDLDSEIIPALIKMYIKKGEAIAEALKLVFNEIEGEASIALFADNLNYLILGTNVGSIYTIKNNDFFCFVSEEYIARQLCKSRYKIKFLSDNNEINHIFPGEIHVVDISSLNISTYNFNKKEKISDIMLNLKYNRIIKDKYEDIENRRANLKRCTKCILPTTMPFIEFDSNGVCNYCRKYKKRELKGIDVLERELSRYRSRIKNKADCLVAFSGGRDSCYALHFVKKELGMNPIAYTYDWGMVTGIARRNQSRMTSGLGVEHIWVSADIKWKRKNIAKNVKAWLKRPKLGMIPLFIAGDKQFFYYANKLKKQTGLELMFFSQNPLEKTEFKTGFANVSPEERKDSKFYRIDLEKRIKLAVYYGKEFLLNPRYINMSIFDTIFAYFSYYFIEQNYLFLYDYIPWDENKVNQTLINEYNWELSSDTSTTWRIGDGTAAFYNYIYYTVAGFTENDTLRSNQIRESAISREKALELVKQENQPRWDSIREYFQLINLDFDESIKIIDKIPKLY